MNENVLHRDSNRPVFGPFALQVHEVTRSRWWSDYCDGGCKIADYTSFVRYLNATSTRPIGGRNESVLQQQSLLSLYFGDRAWRWCPRGARASVPMVNAGSAACRLSLYAIRGSEPCFECRRSVGHRCVRTDRKRPRSLYCVGVHEQRWCELDRAGHDRPRYISRSGDSARWPSSHGLAGGTSDCAQYSSERSLCERGQLELSGSRQQCGRASVDRYGRRW